MPRQPRSATIESVLGKLADRLGTAKSVREGVVLFHLTGTGGGEFCLEYGGGQARVVKGRSRRKPALEIRGDAAKIRAILEGKKDAHAQFLSGGIRVRGNLRALSAAGMELGILKHPIVLSSAR
jgi:hypothetical protein